MWMDDKLNICLLFWYFQQHQCLSIAKNVPHNIRSSAWDPILVGPHATPQRAHALRLVHGYHSVGSSWLWVSLLNKCETSNSYCRAMTRFGIKPCWKISNYFQFSVKIFFLYFEHIISPSKRTTWCRFSTVGTRETVLGSWLNTAEVY